MDFVTDSTFNVERMVTVCGYMCLVQSNKRSEEVIIEMATPATCKSNVYDLFLRSSYMYVHISLIHHPLMSMRHFRRVRVGVDMVVFQTHRTCLSYSDECDYDLW